ncbi:hypothetical protein SPKIRA_38250 (plasmid) [Sphingomonas paucimobilis]|nr:hypothetical protein SPKIRA_38250 [Sphingomonas paucimobilis]
MTTIAQSHAAASITESDRLLTLLPGIGLCLVVTGVAYALEAGERAWRERRGWRRWCSPF